MRDQTAARQRMVESQIAARGVRHARVLQAMREVPRDAFVPEDLAEFAYEDTALPIEAGQTISQPYIVAQMLAAADPSPEARALEIGAGSGYAAAVLSRLVREVYTVERHPELARLAGERLRRLGYGNATVRQGDGSRGWREHAPYDLILVTAAAPEVPESLLEQLAPGGRLIAPVGSPEEQRLVRVTRNESGSLSREVLEAVRFVPLVGSEGWRESGGRLVPPPRPSPGDHALTRLVAETCHPLDDIDSAELGSLLERIGDARVVLIGEASHGTSEFYRMRARVTRELVAERGFSIVAAEADWPDAAAFDRYVRHHPPGPAGQPPPFTRFPVWMWRNEETANFLEWLRTWNGEQPEERRAGFYGLDLYSLYGSVHAVLDYLDDVDPGAALVARTRYGCLTPWQHDPAVYGQAALSPGFRTCEAGVVAMLQDLLQKRLEYMEQDGDRFFGAVQNARLVADAERYYRTMYYGSVASWNLRDSHMFDTLRELLAHRGPGAKAVVWAHNSHVGNAGATEMSLRGEHNIGQLSRREFGANAFIIGFGTDHGTVAAATNWDDPMEVKQVRAALPRSYERLCHESGVPAFLLHLRHPDREELREELLPQRLERAIGVIYRPETERQSHYFEAVLPEQFDEYIWFDETAAVHPVPAPVSAGLPETWPFGV